MDLDELLTNIEKARDAAREDAAAFHREFKELAEGKRLEGIGSLMAHKAAEAVDVALSRILGETRTRQEFEDR